MCGGDNEEERFLRLQTRLRQEERCVQGVGNEGEVLVGSSRPLRWKNWPCNDRRRAEQGKRQQMKELGCVSYQHSFRMERRDKTGGHMTGRCTSLQKKDINPTHKPKGRGLLWFDRARGYLEEKGVKKKRERGWQGAGSCLFPLKSNCQTTTPTQIDTGPRHKRLADCNFNVNYRR